MKLPAIAALGAALCFATTSCKHTETSNNTGGAMSSKMEVSDAMKMASFELERSP